MTEHPDGFEAYYTEKLWQLIPEVYRHEDGLLQSPHVLREIVSLIAEQAAIARRSIDRLWEDQHIETSDDWAVPYIGDLVAARLVSAQDRRARRVDVANSIRFRRRRGTPGLLAALVRAMSGWDVVLVEGFQRLARTRHRLDGPPAVRGRFTKTPVGGTADLRSPAGAEAAHGAWSEYYHTLDTRLLRGQKGRFGVRKLNFHLYTLRAYVMKSVDPFELSGALRTFTVDPSGRDVPLFINGEAGDDTCGSEPEWNVTHPMRCRLMGQTAYRIRGSHINTLGALPAPPLGPDEDAMRRALGHRFESETAMRNRLRDLGATVLDANLPDWYRELVELALEAGTGKAELYPRQVQIAGDGTVAMAGRVAAGDLSDASCHPAPVGGLAEFIISPETGRVATVPPAEPAGISLDVVRYAYGFSGEVGAGPYSRSVTATTTHLATAGVVPGGVLQDDGLTFVDSRTYALTIDAANPVPNVSLLVADQERPLVRLSGGPENPFGATLTPVAEEQTVVLDGGWYASSALDGQISEGGAADFAIAATGGGADPSVFDFESIEISNATFDPGGRRGDGVVIPPLRIVVRTAVRRLMIKRSIVGPIVVELDNDAARVDELVICESIVDATSVSDGLAISNLFGEVVVVGSTVLGDLDAAVLRCTNSIVFGRVRVVNNQAGCFRFSASSPSTASEPARLPPRFRDYHAPFSPAWLCSTRFGDPNYGQLSLLAPKALTTGAENGSEMGVFCHLMRPIRLRSVRAKVDEYGPVGMLAQYLLGCNVGLKGTTVAGPLSPEPGSPSAVVAPDPGSVIEAAPPEPVQLPTECGEETVEEETGGGLDEIEEAAIDLADADLNGAPKFWRAGNWQPEGLPPSFHPDAEGAGIPFDKVDALLEYDARLGTTPEQQGWSLDTSAARREFRLGPGALSFGISDESGSGGYEAQTEIPEGVELQLHAYAFLRVEPPRSAPVEREPDGAASDHPEPTRPDAPGQGASSRPMETGHDAGTLDKPGPLASFGFAALGPRSQKESTGLRARWQSDGRRVRFAYVSLDGGNEQLARSIEGAERFHGGWHSVSLQGAPTTDQAVMSNAGRAQKESLGWFGAQPAEGGGQRLTARFGLGMGRSKLALDESTKDKAAPAFAGQLRNLVLSHPGRFIRAWVPATAPHKDPTLVLTFSHDPLRKAEPARITLRFGPRTFGQAATALPERVVSRTLKVPDEGVPEQTTLSVRLEGLSAQENIWFTVERDHTSRSDAYRGTLRLVEASFKTRRRRTQ